MIFANILISLFAICAYADEYTVQNYPNPRKGGAKECKMRSSSNVCDPYETLNEGERYRINNQLTKFSKQTEENGSSFCERKGTDVIFVIHNQASQQFADGLRHQWNMDAQCGRTGLLVLSINDRKLYGSFDERSPIKIDELNAIIVTEEELIQTGSYTSGVVNVLKELASKQDTFVPGAGAATTQPTKVSECLNLMLSFIVTVVFMNM